MGGRQVKRRGQYVVFEVARVAAAQVETDVLPTALRPHVVGAKVQLPLAVMESAKACNTCGRANKWVDVMS